MRAPALKRLLAGLAVVAITSEGQGAEPASGTPIVRVYVYNHVTLRRRLLSKAMEQAGHIFRRARVRLEWSQCLPSNPGDQSGCRRPCAQTDLTLRIITRPKQDGGKFLQEESLGFTPADGGPGCYATIFYDRVEKVSGQVGVARHVILGHAIAHEIAHVLLPSGHSGHGLMKRSWNADDLNRMRRGFLPLTPDQVHSIHSRITPSRP